VGATGEAITPSRQGNRYDQKVRQESGYFEGKEPVLIYIAKRLKDALRLEDILTEAGLEYGVEADEYQGGIIFRGARTGAFFYVLPESLAAAQDVMRRHQYKLYSA